jgi:hypothetical protein
MNDSFFKVISSHAFNLLVEKRQEAGGRRFTPIRGFMPFRVQALVWGAGGKDKYAI